MTENKDKVYGLILPKKAQAKENKAKASTFNVFGDESDEEEAPKGPVGPYGQAKANTKMKRQTQMDIEKALQEDPSVYEYDNIYDDMQASKPKVGGGEKKKVAKDRKPKYIADLLKASDEKKKEDERRKERQVQKEREAEGEKFADKESFVTSAYKKKMLEMQEEAEKEKRKAELEALTDVTKQKDMSGFYRYLYRQTTGPDVKPEVKQESDSDDGQDRTAVSSKNPTDVPVMVVKQEPDSPHVKRSRSSSSGSDSDSGQSRTKKTTNKPTFNNCSKNHAASQFRKRRVDSSDCDSSPKRRDNTHKQRDGSAEDLSRSKHKTSSRHRKTRSRSRSPADKKSSHHQNKDTAERRRNRSRSRSPRQQSGSRRRQSRSISVSPQRGNTLRKRSLSTEKNTNESTEYKSRNSGSRDFKNKKGEVPRVEYDEIKENLKDLRNKSNSVEKLSKENCPAEKSVKEISQRAVSPSKKIYPHHNSAKDIQEARKRYLQRKLERERSYVA